MAKAEEQKALQINAPGGVVSWDDFKGNDWESDGTDDITPSFPSIKIVQGTSTMDGAGRHGGDFWHSDTEDFTPTLECVALVRRETRAYFEEGADGPQCLSTNGIEPLPAQPYWATRGPQPQVCDHCPLAQWGEDNTPPPCKLSNVLLIDRGEGDLAQLRISGKSLRVLRQFIARRCRPKRLPLYAYRLTMRTVERSEPSKKWHELVIDGELMTPAEAQKYSDVLRAQREQFERGLKQDGAVEWPEDLPRTDDGFIDV